MAIDATGAPTSLGIPKFNTAVDAPSGKGSNAQMDAIDLLIASLPVKPAGLATGEFMVYDSGTTTFKRSTVQRPGMDSLGTGTPDNTKFLRGDGSWQVIGAVGYGTAFPGSPADGAEFILVDSTTNPTYSWRCRFNAGSAFADKWEFIGGSPAIVEVLTDETTTSLTYVGLTTAGPSFTVPRAGVYDIGIESTAVTNTAGAHALHSFDAGVSLGNFTVTIASPGVFTLNAHGLVANDPVFFTTTGALPTGLSVGTTYFVIAAGLTANAFEVSTTVGGAAVNTSGTQSGTHSLFKGTAAIDADALRVYAADAGFNAKTAGKQTVRKTGILASAQLVSRYKVAAASTAHFLNRRLVVAPVRLS